MNHKFRNVIVLILATIAVVSCRKQTKATTKESSTDSNDQCGGEAQLARRKDTFNRTVDCAQDAFAAGATKYVGFLKESIVGVQNIGALARIINAAKTATDARGVNVAKTTLCLRVLEGAVVQNTLKNTVELAAKASPLNDQQLAEFKGFSDLLVQYGALDSASTFEALARAVEKPSIETVTNFAANAMAASGDWAGVLTACTGVFSSVASVAAPNVAQLKGLVGKIGDTVGPAAGIIKCSSALIFNSIDVGNETACLLKDWDRIAEQNETIRRMADSYVERQTEPGTADDCSARYSSKAHNLGRFCATKMDTACGKCVNDNSAVYLSQADGCEPLGDAFLNHQEVALERCNIIKTATP